MDTVSTFVEDEDDDGAPETYYYSSEGGENREGRSRQRKGGREQAQLPLGETRNKERYILPRNYFEGKIETGKGEGVIARGNTLCRLPFFSLLKVTSPLKSFIQNG